MAKSAQTFGFNIQSPQDILQEEQDKRTQMIASGNPLLQQQAIIGMNLESLFGNKRAKAAQGVIDSLQEANNTDYGQPSELENEMMRLKTIRDRLASSHPEIADQVRGRLVELEQEKLQRDKLLATDRREAKKEQKDDLLFPSQLASSESGAAKAALDLQEEQGKGVNLWRKGKSGIERQAITATDATSLQQAFRDGWTIGNGPTTEAEAGDALGLTKPTENSLQKSIIDSQKGLDALGRSLQKFSPEFMELPTQAQMYTVEQLSKLKIRFDPETMAKKDRFDEFRTTAVGAFNTYIESITGAQMAVAEAQRIQKAYIDAINDSSGRFVSKARAVYKELYQINKRAKSALVNGLVVKGDQWNAIAMPDVTDAEVDDWLGKLNPAFKRAEPAAAPAGQAAGSSNRDKADAILNGNK